MNKNDEIILKIDGTSSDGNGVGRYNGMAVFVPLTTEGDEARVKIVKVKKTYAYGKLIELITPSPDRVDSDCPVFARCGGCVYRHINYEKECEIKRNKVQNNMARIGGFAQTSQPIIAAERPCRYRNKAQYPVSQNGATGFYAVHSHRIIESDTCLLQPEIFEDICRVFTAWIRQYGISVYNEETGRGLVRHLYLRHADKTGEIMVTVIINGDSLPYAAELTDALLEALGKQLCSLQININKRDTNVILGDKCRTIYGQDYITDILCGVKIRISPLSFYQVNRDMAEKLYEKAREYARPEGKTVLDLYCGAGTIGLSMAREAKRIIGVEIVPEAIEDAKINAKENGINNAEFICMDASAAAKQLSARGLAPDTVIVDPPRKGCSEELLGTIANDFRPERLVYVSCDSATLARDCAHLRELGYDLIEYTPVDMFPSTAHVETVVCLSKR